MQCATGIAKPCTTSRYHGDEDAGEGNPEAITVAVDGIVQSGNVVLLADDRMDHRVEVRVAAERPAPATAST